MSGGSHPPGSIFYDQVSTEGPAGPLQTKDDQVREGIVLSRRKNNDSSFLK